MKFRNIAMCLTAVAGLVLSSCIREDRSDCYNVYMLELSYLGDGTEEIFAEKIDKVRMYVFDDSGNCIVSRQISDEDVRSRVTQLPPLEEGDYRVVCVGNAYSTRVEGLSSSDLNSVFFAAGSYLDGSEVSGNDPLYWASVTYHVVPFDEYRQVETVKASFASSHYDISVEVSGVPAVKSDGYPLVQLVGVSPCTDFTNRAFGEPVTYQMETAHDGDRTLKAYNNIMRHTAHEDVFLRVISSDGSRILAETSFADFLARYGSYIDVTKHEVLIPFKVQFLSADVTVSLPEWMINEIKPEF